VTAVARQMLDEDERIAEQLDRLLEVDDVDAVP
jgi:hypothetical protein